MIQLLQHLNLDENLQQGINNKGEDLVSNSCQSLSSKIKELPCLKPICCTFLTLLSDRRGKTSYILRVNIFLKILIALGENWIHSNDKASSLHRSLKHFMNLCKVNKFHLKAILKENENKNHVQPLPSRIHHVFLPVLSHLQIQQ